MSAKDYIRWFSDIRLSDVAVVGGKNASLGELYSTLSKKGVRIPNGFAPTADAYRDALTAGKARERLHQLLDNLDKRDVETLAKRAASVSTRSASIRQASCAQCKLPAMPRVPPLGNGASSKAAE